MAFITQYDIDMQRQRGMDQGLNQALQGFQGVEENRRRALDLKRQQEKEALSYAQSGATVEDIEKAQSGDLTGLQKFYSEDYQAKKKREADKMERELQDSMLDRDYKRSQIALNNRKASETQNKMSDQQKIDYRLSKEQEAREQKKTSEEYEVPGLGFVRTPDEAKTIRTAKADAETAKEYINQLKALGTNVAIWDRDRIGKINQLKQALVGKLRLPLMGPGTMTEDEFQRTVDNLGDPSALFGTEKNEIGKLDQMSNILDKNIEAMYSAAASNNQPKRNTVQQAPQDQVQIPPQVQQKINQMTPEQKQQRLLELQQKAGGR
jgi:hypothetical protein